MVNKQLTRSEPVFWVAEATSETESTERRLQVKSGFYIQTLDVNGSIKWIVSLWPSGILVKQLDPEFVFLTEEEANTFIKELEAVRVESN